MRLLFVCLLALASCGVPNTGCPSAQPPNGSSCTATEACTYDGGTAQVTCHCIVPAGSTGGTWACN